MSLRFITIFFTSLTILLVILFIIGFRFVIVLTDSMEPTVPKGSLVVTAPAWLVKPTSGSIVLYVLRLERGEWLVLHRIVAVDADLFLTKGDSRGFIDPWMVEPGNVVGVAVLVVPFLGYLLLFLRAFIPVLVSIFVFFLIYMLLRRVMHEQEVSSLYDGLHSGDGVRLPSYI